MKKTIRFFKYLFLSVSSFLGIFPFFWMIISMTNKSVEVTKGRLVPGTYLLENLKALFESRGIVTAMVNSTIIAVVSTILTLLISSLAGYAFEIYRTRTRDWVFNILLVSMMIPFAAIMIPLYRFFGTLGGVVPGIGINTFAAVILPTLTTGFFIFLFRQNTKMFEKELVDAARIDGVSELGIFFRIYIPTMKTTYASAAIIAFMNSWNNYLWPLVVLQSPDKQTIPLYISNLGSAYAPDYGLLMTAIAITTLPTALVFFFMQKHFVSGMLGSVKG